MLHCASGVVCADPRAGKGEGLGVTARFDHLRFDLPSTFGLIQRRRSERILWRAPILTIWTDPSGHPCSQAGETEIVNAHGGLIRLQATLQPGEWLQIVHARTNEAIWARVVWRESVASSPGVRLGVELGHPNEDFWGVHIPISEPGTT